VKFLSRITTTGARRSRTANIIRDVMPRPLLAILLFALATQVRAALPTQATTAMLVEEADEKQLDVALSDALASADPAVRTIAARVATVRGRTTLLPRIEPLLDSETNPETGRELVRAAILLGGAKNIDAAIVASERFGHRLDSAVAVATARLGGDRARRVSSEARQAEDRSAIKLLFDRPLVRAAGHPGYSGKTSGVT
jgi:hypothetical protein